MFFHFSVVDFPHLKVLIWIWGQEKNDTFFINRKEERKEGRKEGRQEGKKREGKERRKEGKKEGRKGIKEAKKGM